MPNKLSITNIALVCFTLVLVLCVYGIFMLPVWYRPSYAVYATKLGDKPSNYFALPNPDKYVLEAITDQHSSVFNSLDETQIDELPDRYGTNIIEYNGAYYSTAIMYGDIFPPYMLPQALLTGIAVSILAITVACVSKVAKYNKKQK